MNFKVEFDREKVNYDIALHYAQTMLDHSLRENEIRDFPAPLETEALEYFFRMFKDAVEYLSDENPPEWINPANNS